MAVTTIQTIINAARPGVKEYIKVEGERLNLAKMFHSIDSKLEYELFRQMSDFGLPKQVNEGSPSLLDNKINLYGKVFTPLEYALKFGITNKAKYTDNYNLFSSYKEDIKEAFLDLDSLSYANIFNNGFSSSYTGIDGVALFHATHPYKSLGSWSNRPGSNLALSAPNLETMRQNYRKTKTARNRWMRMRGGMYLLIPPDLEYQARHILNSTKQAYTADNTSNELSSEMEMMVIEELSSATAFFFVPKDKNKHGLFRINQMPLDILSSPDFDVHTRTMYVSIQKSFVDGWKKAQGLYASPGA